jgi:hypothetical protein
MRFHIDFEDFDEYFMSTEDEERPDRLYDYRYISISPTLIYYYYILDDIFKWFKDLNIEYQMGYQSQGKDITGDFSIKSVISMDPYSCYWYIDIKDENKAMLFKLTWM